MKIQPLRLVLYSGSESRRDFADLSITVSPDDKARLDVDAVHSTLRTVTAERHYSDPEDLVLALAHRLMDTQSSLTKVSVEVAANSWRRLGPHAFERGSAEVRVAQAAVGRDGSASVSAAIRGLKLLMGSPAIESVDLEWTYRGAGVSYNSAWSAVRKMALQAFDDREAPQAIAQLLLDVIDTLAEVRLTVDCELLTETGHAGLLAPSGTPKRDVVVAKSR